jgi:hypothetical protein
MEALWVIAVHLFSLFFEAALIVLDCHCSRELLKWIGFVLVLYSNQFSVLQESVLRSKIWADFVASSKSPQECRYTRRGNVGRRRATT